MSKRPQFLVGGSHPLLYLTRDFIIQLGFELTTEDLLDETRPAFLLFGAEVFHATKALQMLDELRDLRHLTIPVLLLSSSSVYGDRDAYLGLREEKPCDEAQALVLTSSIDPDLCRPASALLAEHAFIQRTNTKTVVLRPFNVYGPSVDHGVIHRFITAARLDESLTVYSPGRQVRSFLFEEDYLEAVRVLLSLLLRGGRGIYNVGSEDRVELLSLAKSVGHAMGKEAKIEMISTEAVARRHAWWKLPDVDRLKALKWKPTMSLRSGLFRMTGRS